MDSASFERFIAVGWYVLKMDDAPDAIRIEVACSLAALLAKRDQPDADEFFNPMFHAETKAVWDAIEIPIQRLAALAEERGIDSTSLLTLAPVRFYKQVVAIGPLLARLLLLEDGPDLGDECEARDLASWVTCMAALLYGPVDCPPTAVPSESPSQHRRPARKAADKARDEGSIAAYIADHPETTRDAIAKATGIARAHVSESMAWKAHRAAKRQVASANRARGVGGDTGERE